MAGIVWKDNDGKSNNVIASGPPSLADSDGGNYDCECGSLVPCDEGDLVQDLDNFNAVPNFIKSCSFESKV